MPHPAAVAQIHLRADHRVGAHLHAGTQSRAGIDQGGGMNLEASMASNKPQRAGVTVDAALPGANGGGVDDEDAEHQLRFGDDFVLHPANADGAGDFAARFFPAPWSARPR
jgi:hypothetical protein